MHPLDLVRQARALFLDWDGCVVENNAFKPGARAFLRAHQSKISILSNASAQTPSQIARILARAGLAIPQSRIFLAGHVALELASERFAERAILLLGASAMRRYSAKLGLRSGDKNPQAVILLRDTDFSYARLRQAAIALRGGASLIVANPDLTHPCGDGLNPETGALLAALGACVDLSKIDMTIVGKPNAPLFERALRVSNCAPHQALMIGDNPATDIEGARRAGLKSILLDDARGLTLAALLERGNGHDVQKAQA